MGFGPVIQTNEDGTMVLNHVSASQIKVYEDCPYRWYSEKALKTPLLGSWSYSDVGIATHEMLEKQVGNSIGIEFNESKRKVYAPHSIKEAQKIMNSFSWSQYFEGHTIVDVEAEYTINLNTNTPLPPLVMSPDVVSINEKGVYVITEWKTGFASDKGIDIQPQVNVLGVMEEFNTQEVIYRRIYPRIVLALIS